MLEKNKPLIETPMGRLKLVKKINYLFFFVYLLVAIGVFYHIIHWIILIVYAGYGYINIWAYKRAKRHAKLALAREI